MPVDLTDHKSTLVQVMAWCRQATSHYLSQCWPKSLSPYGAARPQWVNLYVLETRIVKIKPNLRSIPQMSWYPVTARFGGHNGCIWNLMGASTAQSRGAIKFQSNQITSNQDLVASRLHWAGSTGLTAVRKHQSRSPAQWVYRSSLQSSQSNKNVTSITNKPIRNLTQKWDSI